MSDKRLDGAYALGSLAATKSLYADWAETYDKGFVEKMSFKSPELVAQAFEMARGTGPVLDFGAGTGALGVHLAQKGIGPIDAVDLSPEMLDVAREKAVYRAMYAGNLLGGLVLVDRYLGVVSSGTFTHGHVGPEGLQALLDVAEPGAQFALSINAEHYRAAGFSAAFEVLSDQIEDLTLPETKLYGQAATGAHKDDTGFIALFRKRMA